MGCSCTSDCAKSAEELAEFNDDNNVIKINETIMNNPKLLSSLIKLQSQYRGMKYREKYQINNQINNQNNIIKIII